MGKIKFTYNQKALQIIGAREINASAEAIYKAHAEKSAVEAWWGRKQDKLSISKFEFKDGGAWEFNTSGEEGDFRFFGNYMLLKEPHIISWTFNFEYPEMPDIIQSTEINYIESISSMKSKIIFINQSTTKEGYDSMAHTGMEGGAEETWDRLEEFASGI